MKRKVIPYCFGRDVTRREFLRRTGAGSAALAAWAAVAPLARGAEPTASPADLAVIRGDDPAANVRAAIEAIGGMKRFVKKGDVVVVKPNIGWDRTPEQAANTNPQVVGELVALAFAAGASKVKVFDNTCNNPRACYTRSGIEKAAVDAGATVLPFDGKRCKNVPIPDGEFIKEWPVFVDALECDAYINVPVAKVHGLSKLTLGLKNAMGIIGGNRGQWHQNIDVILADFLAVVKPKLTVIDAYRILTANGPSGGNLADVRLMKTCIATADPVAADARAAALFGKTIDELGFIGRAARKGFGTADLSKIRVVEKG
ncbi:MAG: DUF362 domain-containing protein [Candidatus Sumerlaeaceae bacterium]|nr:DUF362 domain-containing protein [Candidatus Sumerlaeaceae bacterium]